MPVQTPQCDIEHLIFKHNAVTLYEANEKAALFITLAIVRRRSRGVQVLHILVTAFFLARWIYRAKDLALSFACRSIPSWNAGPRMSSCPYIHKLILPSEHLKLARHTSCTSRLAPDSGSYVHVQRRAGVKRTPTSLLVNTLGWVPGYVMYMHPSL